MSTVMEFGGDGGGGAVANNTDNNHHNTHARATHHTDTAIAVAAPAIINRHITSAGMMVIPSEQQHIAKFYSMVHMNKFFFGSCDIQ